MEIPDRLLRIVYDTAVSSMDFGSGFLDDSEVAALREIAVILGTDPETATPGNFKCKYRGHHAARPYLDPSFFDSFADSRKKNAYVHLDERRVLYKDDCPRIGMWCPDCGRRWDAFEDTSYVRES